MSNMYDNWERLVAAVIRREQLWQMFHDQSPSSSSMSSDSSLDSSLINVPYDFSSPRDSPPYQHLPPPAVEKSQKREKSIDKGVSGLVFIEGFNPAFVLEDMLRTSTEFLADGTFGSAYKAEMDNGIVVVLKRLNVVNIPEKKFKQHMEVIGNVRHENISALRAYYFSKDEKLMVYDHYSNGSVSAMLHGKIGENPAHLDWGTRLRIAVGAARGIAHIHKQSGGKLVHGNIKSSNIFLNSQLYGCVSDLGMAKMIATPVMQTARYHAPEVKNTQNVSQASDVYSFGILLLELLTRKSPLHATSGDLVKLVNSVNGKEQTANVFDVELLRNRNIEEQMIKMLQIGMSCIARTPKKRLKMAEVVKMIEDISMMNTRNRLQQKLVFTEDLNPAFDYDDMMMASVEVLGKGTFGTSFRATLLGNRISFVVKRLTDVNVTGEAFHQKMEVIGRMRHENVASLMAYYRSKHENLVLYDYHGQGSISSMVHGKRGDNHTSLEWETRLRIAVGAARGIAHIHSQVGQTLVHGNVKSSNIFLNAQGYGCVSEGGLTTLMSQWALPVLRSAGYFAPELTDTKTVSQASDVYGFGVVLLELLTGKPAIRSAADGEAIQLVSWVNSIVYHEWTGEVFDIQLLKYPSLEDAMLKLLQIGMICSASDPWRRLKMSEVVKILEDISG